MVEILTNSFLLIQLTLFSRNPYKHFLFNLVYLGLIEIFTNILLFSLLYLEETPKTFFNLLYLLETPINNFLAYYI